VDSFDIFANPDGLEEVTDDDRQYLNKLYKDSVSILYQYKSNLFNLFRVKNTRLAMLNSHQVVAFKINISVSLMLYNTFLSVTTRDVRSTKESH